MNAAVVFANEVLADVGLAHKAEAKPPSLSLQDRKLLEIAKCIATKLNGWLTANLNFNDRYNSQPVLGNKKNDVLFTTGLGVTFGAKPAK